MSRFGGKVEMGACSPKEDEEAAEARDDIIYGDCISV